jgi:NAD(P)-dependent dehydrogenase (short-subunit alcohol dehydrogenase family)
MSSKWTAEQIPDQSGRTAIVTGANSGLGLIVARELARAGAHVILTSRDAGKGAMALDTINSRQSGRQS